MWVPPAVDGARPPVSHRSRARCERRSHGLLTHRERTRESRAPRRVRAWAGPSCVHRHVSHCRRAHRPRRRPRARLGRGRGDAAAAAAGSPRRVSAADTITGARTTSSSARRRRPPQRPRAATTASSAARATTASSAAPATTCSPATPGTTCSTAAPAATRCSAARATTASRGGPATPDVIVGGAGNDVINARDGVATASRCGPGRDRVRADPSDQVGARLRAGRRG